MFTQSSTLVGYVQAHREAGGGEQGILPEAPKLVSRKAAPQGFLINFYLSGLHLHAILFLPLSIALSGLSE